MLLQWNNADFLKQIIKAFSGARNNFRKPKSAVQICVRSAKKKTICNFWNSGAQNMFRAFEFAKIKIFFVSNIEFETHKAIQIQISMFSSAQNKIRMLRSTFRLTYEKLDAQIPVSRFFFFLSDSGIRNRIRASKTPSECIFLWIRMLRHSRFKASIHF